MPQRAGPLGQPVALTRCPSSTPLPNGVPTFHQKNADPTHVAHVSTALANSL